MSAHLERCVYLRLPLESVNPVFQRISTVYIDIWLRFPARSKSLFGRGSSGPLLLRPVPALQRNYTKRSTRDDAGVKREIGRAPRARRVPPFENCPAVLDCQSARRAVVPELHSLRRRLRIVQNYTTDLWNVSKVYSKSYRNFGGPLSFHLSKNIYLISISAGSKQHFNVVSYIPLNLL